MWQENAGGTRPRAGRRLPEDLKDIREGCYNEEYHDILKAVRHYQEQEDRRFPSILEIAWVVKNIGATYEM